MLSLRGMTRSQNTQLTANKTDVLDAWFQAVNSHLAVRRLETRNLPRPKRNRERERARRQARQLFAEYYRDLAVASAQAA